MVKSDQEKQKVPATTGEPPSLGKWISLALLAFFVLVLTIITIGRYNSLVAHREKITVTWTQVEMSMRQQVDAGPRLVDVVKKYVITEDTVCEGLETARLRALEAQTPRDRVTAYEDLQRNVTKALALEERFPRLRVDDGFRQLREELLGNESQIVRASQTYIRAVGEYNTLRSRFPANLIASVAGMEPVKAFITQPPDSQP